MPTKKTQIACPNCRQPILVEAQQLFDIRAEPASKERLLSGAANLAQCPHCRFQGPIQLPIVYHDPARELLLTHVPQELGLPMHQQERIIGPLITQAVNSLPQAERKAYLFQPKTMFTMQTMIETILAADGITKEMMQSQQERMNLIQRMANITSADILIEVAKQEDKVIDRDFFQIMSTLVNNALAGGQEALARRLTEVQRTIVPVTTYGQKIQQQSREIEEVAAALRNLGEKATREDLLELVTKTSSETQVQAFVSMARGGMDYPFFQALSDRIERARGDGRQRLVDLRQQLLELTRQYDEQMELQLAQTRKLLDALLAEPDMHAILAENPGIVDEFFVQVLQTELDAARKSGDLLRGGKLQQIVEILNELTAPAPEADLIDKLVDAPDEATRQSILESLPANSVQNLVEMLMGVMQQVEASSDTETLEMVKAVYKQALRFSMRAKIKKA